MTLPVTLSHQGKGGLSRRALPRSDLHFGNIALAVCMTVWEETG